MSSDAPAARLRVVTVCPYSLSRPGGVQSQAVGLTRALAARGHRAVLFAPIDDAAGPPEGVEFEPSGHSVSLPSNGSMAPVALSPIAAARARRALYALAPDVVHVHEPFAPGLSYGLLAGPRHCPIVATFHRSGPSRWYSLLRPLTARMAGRLAARCAVSEAARSTAARALGGTYEVLFNGIEVDRLRSSHPWPSDRPALLFLGRHEERKGLGVLLEAFERLGARVGSGDGGDRARPVLWIAGDGPLTETLRRRYPPSDDRCWLGVLSEEEKARRIVAAEAVCVPSLGGESFGLVLLEAMAAGTVVVASDIEGYRDAAGGRAVLVGAGDVDSWARALSDVLEGARAVASSEPGEVPTRKGWLALASARAEQWSMARLAGRYEDLYRSVVAGTAR